MSDSLGPQGLQHARLLCPSLSPWVCSNSCPLSQWCHPTVSPSLAPFFCSQCFPASGSLPIRWPKYWSFSISLSDENSGLSSFRTDSSLAVQGTLKSLLQLSDWTEASSKKSHASNHTLFFHDLEIKSLQKKSSRREGQSFWAHPAESTVTISNKHEKDIGK